MKVELFHSVEQTTAITFPPRHWVCRKNLKNVFSHLLLPSVLLHSRGVGRRGSFAITLPCHCILRTNLLLSRSCSSHPRQFSRGFPAGGRLPQILHGQIWPCDLTSLRGTWSEAALTRLTTGAAADRVSASPGRAASFLSLPFVKLIVFILFGALASLRRRLTVGCSPLLHITWTNFSRHLLLSPLLFFLSLLLSSLGWNMFPGAVWVISRVISPRVSLNFSWLWAKSYFSVNLLIFQWRLLLNFIKILNFKIFLVIILLLILFFLLLKILEWRLKKNDPDMLAACVEGHTGISVISSVQVKDSGKCAN